MDVKERQVRFRKRQVFLNKAVNSRDMAGRRIYLPLNMFKELRLKSSIEDTQLAVSEVIYKACCAYLNHECSDSQYGEVQMEVRKQFNAWEADKGSTPPS